MGTNTNKTIIRSEKRKNNSVTISNSIITDNNLKPLDKMVLIYILSESNTTVLFQRSIANNLGVTLGTVIKTFKNLEMFGYVIRDKSNGNVDNYTIYETGYMKNAQPNSTDAKIEQPKNDNLNRVKKMVQNKFTSSTNGIKNVVKDTIGMLKVDVKPKEETYSFDIVLSNHLQKSDTSTKLRLLDVLSKISHEINSSDYCLSKNKLRESLTWLNVNKSNIKLSETEVLELQLEIDTFINQID